MCEGIPASIAGAVIALFMVSAPVPVAAASGTTQAIAAAVSDASRPSSDTERDVDRKPADTLAFAGVRPGDAVADYAAGGGYFTRLLSGVVGPEGHVYAVVPSPLYTIPTVVRGTADIQAWAVGHPNVTVIFASALQGVRFPEKLDLFFISQNYHDLHDRFMGPVDLAAFNKAVYAALKPGGTYLVLDHAAASGAAADVTETLHRIEPATVRREVEAAGFRFEGESAVLANPADPHTAGVFDTSIRGHTDQFIYKFRKPRS